MTTMNRCVRAAGLVMLDHVTVGLRFRGDHRGGRAGQSTTCVFGTELEGEMRVSNEDVGVTLTCATLSVICSIFE